MFKRIATNIFSNWANLLVNIVISFFLAPFVVAKLGNTYYGLWVIMMQFTGYLYLLDFGVRESIIRYVSKAKADGYISELNEKISSGIILYTGIGLISLFVTVILAITFPYVFDIKPEDIAIVRFVVIISGLTVTQLFAFNVFMGILMGLQRYDIFNKIGIVFAFLRLGLIVYFLGQGYSLVALALIQLFIGLATNVTIYIYSIKTMKENDIPFQFTRTPLKERMPIFVELFNYSKHVLINNLGQKAIFSTDAIIIGVLLSPVSVTFYAIAGNLIEYLRRIVIQVTSVLNPVASELEARNEDSRLIQLVMDGSKYTMAIALPVSAIYLWAGSHFIGLWMGKEYAELSGKVLGILTFTVLLSIPQLTLASVLYGISKHHIISKLRIYEAVSNLVLSVILALHFGIVGVALGTAIPQLLFMGLVLPVLVSRHVNYSFTHYLVEIYLRPFVSIIPFFLGYLVISWWVPPENLLIFFFEIALCLPVYGISVYLLCFNRPEKEKTILMLGKLKLRMVGR